MARRGDSLGSMLRSWARESRDGALGRIHTVPGFWVFVKDAPKLKPGEREEWRHHSTDADGEPMVLVGRRAVFCRNRKWQGQYARIVNGNDTTQPGTYAVPFSKCQKCEFYQKSSRSIRFPCCLYRATATTKADAEIAGVASVLDGLNKAAEWANKIIK